MTFQIYINSGIITQINMYLWKQLDNHFQNVEKTVVEQRSNDVYKTITFLVFLLFSIMTGTKQFSISDIN